MAARLPSLQRGERAHIVCFAKFASLMQREKVGSVRRQVSDEAFGEIVAAAN